MWGRPVGRIGRPGHGTPTNCPCLLPLVYRELPTSLRGGPDPAPEPAGPDLDVETAEEEVVTSLAEPGPQPCLHISITGSGLEMAPDPAEEDPRPELVPFDSDSDDESSPSPSGTLQSQASRSTISSSFGSEWGWRSGQGPGQPRLEGSGPIDGIQEALAFWCARGIWGRALMGPGVCDRFTKPELPQRLLRKDEAPR